MHSIPTHSEAESDLDAVPPHRLRNRLIVGFSVLLVILILLVVPPLINVSRFQHRIERNIGNSIGRNVTFDRVSLSLLPLPGFTLENFVIDEDPAFGSEPILWASQVDVTLRLSSIWHRHVEFSKIALTDASSVNLVRLPNGKWNIEKLLLQASRIEAAPTAQRYAGPAPRFPYIEATGARLNLKLGQEKMPFTLTDAEFALWLPEPHQWHLRLQAHPTRTDISPGDTGTIRMEGTLGGNNLPVGALAQIPITLRGSWEDAQLGDFSRLLIARDAGVRGDSSMTFAILGTVDHNDIATNIKVLNARRADFVPPHPLSVEVGCHAVATNTFHSFSSIECHWPPAESSDPGIAIVTADLPNISQPQASSVQVTLPALPADTFLNWLSVATPHPPTGLGGPANLAGTVAWGTSPLPPRSADRPASASPAAQQTGPPQSAQLPPSWSGELEFSGATLDLSPAAPQPIPLGDIILRSTPPAAPTLVKGRRQAPAAPGVNSPPDSFDLLPISLDLGGKEPLIVDGHLDDAGYTLHFSGWALPARLAAFGRAFPQIADGLKETLQNLAILPPDRPGSRTTTEGSNGGSVVLKASAAEPTAGADEPVHLDLTATRNWGSAQVWRQNAMPPSKPHSRR
jgi:hypothetical protein